MATITNTEMLTEISRLLGIQTGINPIPAGSSNFIQPVIQVSNNNKIFRAITSTTTGDASIYTVPNGKTLYITDMSITMQKDATCDNTGVTIYTTPRDGLGGSAIFGIRTLTTTAINQTESWSLNTPIAVSGGTPIVLTGNFTAGTITKQAIIIGYLV